MTKATETQDSTKTSQAFAKTKNKVGVKITPAFLMKKIKP